GHGEGAGDPVGDDLALVRPVEHDLGDVGAGPDDRHQDPPVDARAGLARAGAVGRLVVVDVLTVGAERPENRPLEAHLVSLWVTVFLVVGRARGGRRHTRGNTSGKAYVCRRGCERARLAASHDSAPT